MSRIAAPGPANDYLAGHVKLLADSLRRWNGRELIESGLTLAEASRRLFLATFVLVSHDTSPDPVFNYANRAALALFEMEWKDFTALPSRLSAEAVERGERTRLLRGVSEQGYVDDYSGIRVSATGRRFLIERATVWNLLDAQGNYRGQAAMFDAWRYL